MAHDIRGIHLHFIAFILRLVFEYIVIMKSAEVSGSERYIYNIRRLFLPSVISYGYPYHRFDS